MVATFHGIPNTTIISCYSPTNVSEELKVEQFYMELASLTRQIPKHNILVIGGDFNAQLGKLNNSKFSYLTTANRNGNMLHNFINENNLICLNIHFQKKVEQLWTHKALNKTLAQLDYVLINKKWKNSVQNCRAYTSFISVASDHRIVTANIQLSLRANKNKSCRIKPYDWSNLKNNADIRNKFIIEVKNRFEALQNDEETISTNTATNTLKLPVKNHLLNIYH